MEKFFKIGIEDDNRFAKTWALFLNNMDLAHKNAWAPFSNYTLQLHMDFHGFKWLISFCAMPFSDFYNYVHIPLPANWRWQSCGSKRESMSEMLLWHFWQWQVHEFINVSMNVHL